jgi:hypothetical protein
MRTQPAAAFNSTKANTMSSSPTASTTNLIQMKKHKLNYRVIERTSCESSSKAEYAKTVLKASQSA